MKLLQRRCDTIALTSRVRIAVCLALWQHPCPLRLLRRHLSQSERLWRAVTFSMISQPLHLVSSKTKPLCQGLPFSGELSSGSETERLDKGRLSRERNNAGAALYNLSDIFASLDATSPDKGRLWHSVTFSSKHKSVLSKTRPLCQGLPY